MGGKIDAYLDCVSPYSYFAILYLQKNREILRQYGVEVEFHPVFLGGIMQGSGNTPPWKLENKAKYSGFDSKRAQEYFGVKFSTPSFFPIMSLLPQRALIYIKDNYPQEKYEEVFVQTWVRMWEQHWDISKPEKLAELLASLFSEQDVRNILEAANTTEVKQKLNAVTKLALDSGAFGCPWYLVTNSSGKKEPFFGSDRWHYMWSFLGVPFQDVAIKEKSSL